MLKEEQIRKDLVLDLSQDNTVIETLIKYTENKFVCDTNCKTQQIISMQDESFVSSWAAYCALAESNGVLPVLKSKIVQFQFPVRQSISDSEEYKAATLKGKLSKHNGFHLKEESSLTLHIHKGLAGGIPVLVTGNEYDFCSIVQALRFKNEPVNLPGSMGAVMISGLNNWDRLNAYKISWCQTNPFADWNTEFVKNVLPDKTIYQDKLIVLSRKGYSNISGKDLGINQDEWLDISLEIRLQHEYTHYFTLRYFGHMANNMHDELVADYAGINKVLGRFNSSWFLRFIGLHDYPNYQQGGRLENYIAKDKFSEESFAALCAIMYNASLNVERFDDFLGSCNDDLDRSVRVLCLCHVDLLNLSGPHALSKLQSVYSMLRKEL